MAIDDTRVSPAHTPNTWQVATIERIARETSSVKTFRLRPECWFPFDAGQHLEVRLTAEDGYQAQRNYSIGSSPDLVGSYELAIDRLRDGEVSSWFHDVAMESDRFEIRGPFGGHFVWQSGEEGPVLFVAGGSGIVPIMSMIRYRARSTPSTPTALIYAARRWNDVIFRDALLGHEQSEPHFSPIFAISRDRPFRPQDFNRRLDQEIVASALARLPAPPKVSYVCGSNAFAEAAAQLLVRSGRAPQSIRIERFGQ